MWSRSARSAPLHDLRHAPSPLKAAALALLIAAGISAGAVGADVLQGKVRVSQKDQAFRPDEITIKRGTTVDFVNDDGDLLHHAYVDSPTFSFDSGDQEPGTTSPVAFNVDGNFTVLCGIHPRMKLKVHVVP